MNLRPSYNYLAVRIEAAYLRTANSLKNLAQRIGQLSPLLSWFPRFTHWMAEQFAWAITLPLGVGMGQWDEYAAALVCFGFGCLSIIFKAFHWKGIPSKRATSFLRLLWVAATLGIFYFSYSLTLSKKGDKPWSGYLAQYFDSQPLPSRHIAVFDPPTVPDITEPPPRIPSRIPSRPKPAPPQTNEKPEITATFIQGTSPAIVLLNPSEAIVRDPSCSLTMWNLSRSPPISLPSFTENNPGQYIKQGSGLLLATLDNPSMKPQIVNGDRVFGFVSVDCPECKTARFFWLYVVYGRPAESWYSGLPEGQGADILAVGRRLDQLNWNVDSFLATVPHGEKLTPKAP